MVPWEMAQSLTIKASSLERAMIEQFRFEGLSIRVVGTPNVPEWVAADVCAVLELKGDPGQHLRSFDDDEKGLNSIQTPGGEQEMLTVTEAGLYRLIFKSRKAVAKRFQRWVFHEVLPTIRKTGTYSVQQPLRAEDPIIASLQSALELRQQQLDQERRIAALEHARETALQELRALPAPSVEIPEETTDMKIRRIVNDYSAATGIAQGEVWRRLYQEHYYRYHSRVSPKGKESRLQAFVRVGKVDELYALATELFLSEAVR